MSEKKVKCVIWDLDNTLWDGVLLEGDTLSLKPGIRDILDTLDKRGILHSIASRNNFDDAKKKLEQFGLGNYFLFPQISFGNKSDAIEEIAKKLNIGKDTLLFIDDQEFEREEVLHSHPEVRCIDAPKYTDLLNMPELQPLFITDDSKRRRLMYVEDQQRTIAETEYEGPKEEFLKTLNMHVTISEATEDDLQRLEELTIRTHQLNTTGKTYDYAELFALMNDENYLLLVVSLDDRFGSYGKIGMALIEKDVHKWTIRLFILSCRVMNRGIGTIFLNEIMRKAKDSGNALFMEFLPTDRNRMMYVSLKFANFKEIKAETEENNGILLQNDLSIIQELPPYINLSTFMEYAE